MFGYGITSEQYFQFGFKYCPSVDEWIDLKKLEDGYELTSLTAVGNCFIGIGSFDDETKSFAMKYDPNLDVWTKIQEMPVIMNQYATVAFDDTLLISGGTKNKGTEYTRNFWMYSLAANVWTKLPNINYNHFDHVMLRFGSKIYFIGNASEVYDRSRLENFDMITRKFKTISDDDQCRIVSRTMFRSKYFIKNRQKQSSYNDLELNLYQLMYLSLKPEIDIQQYVYDSIYMYKT